MPLLTPVVTHMFLVVCEEQKIAWIIVGSVMIVVMHFFLWQEVSTDNFLHHQSVLAHIPVCRRIRMVRNLHHHISAAVCAHSTTPKVVTLHRRTATSN